VTRRHDQVRGPLAGCAAGFAAELRRLGYSTSGAQDHLRLLRELSGWLAQEGLAPGELTASQMARFQDGRTRRAHRGLTTAVGAAPLLGYLAGLALIPAQTRAVPAGPCSEVLERYRRYVASERGLTPGEVARHVRTAMMFAGHARAADRGWAAVTAADVTGFVAAQCAVLGRASACKRISQLRSFLRFAHIAGLTATALAPALPSAARWSAASLPRWVRPAQVAALLAACDQRTASGRRDSAVLVLLSRLGLRAGEVAALQLGDIDWRAGTLTIRGKARRVEKMPLPPDVGEAIAGYLAHGRPAADTRSVFLRSRAPRRGLSAQAVSDVVAAAAGRAGLARIGAHQLRHSAATEMLRSGASLDEVSQVLRHRDVATTAIYAKVDHAALAAVARPWPGGEA
jgi:integrase/recombinase XerD